ncbi:MAG: leucine-rich repeat domain-containing protein, partial [Planctomycetota bacterium]
MANTAPPLVPPPLPADAPPGDAPASGGRWRRFGRVVLALTVLAGVVAGLGFALSYGLRWRRCRTETAAAAQALADADRVAPDLDVGLARRRAFREAAIHAQHAVETGLDDGTARGHLERADAALATRDYVIHNTPFARNSILDRRGRPTGDGLYTWTVPARPGDLLEIWTHGRILRYPVAPDTPRELHFRAEGLFYYINGKRIGVELEGPAARRWLNTAPDEEVRDLVYLCTGRIDEPERPGFRRTFSRPLVIDVNNGHVADILPMLPHLNPYALLVNTGIANAELETCAALPDLRILEIDSTNAGALAPIGRMTELEVLRLGDTPDAEHLAPLARLSRLSVLQLANLDEDVTLAPLAACRHLSSFALTDSVTDASLAPLADLPLLRQVRCEPRQYVAEWAELPYVEDALDWLDIDKPEPGMDLRDLQHLVRLEDLALFRPSMRPGGGQPSLDALRPLTRLERLTCYLNPPPDLSALEGMHRLQDLTMNAAEVGHPAALAGKDRLRNLLLLSNAGTLDAAFLADLPRLEQVFVPFGGLAGEWPATLPHLRSVSVAVGAETFGIETLHRLTGLRELAVFGPVDDLQLARIVEQCPQLRNLELNVSRVTDLTPLARLAHLQELQLSGNDNVVDLAPVGRLQTLRGLSFMDLTLPAVGPLGRLQGLQSLALNDCHTPSELQPLAGLQDLRELEITYNREVRDIAFVAGLKKLETLQLSGLSELRGLEPLAGLERLISLHLSSNPRLREED